MMKSIYLNFQIHQACQLKRYRFFNIGRDHDYVDEVANRAAVERSASTCYLPLLTLLLSLVESAKGRFRCSISISGVAVEQFRAYAPELLTLLRRLATTGCVEFVAQSYSHSLSSLNGGSQFEDEVAAHADLMEREFGRRPTVFANTEMIYNDLIGDRVAKMGYKAMVADGSSELLEWRSPNYIYTNVVNQNLSLMLRNQTLSEDFAHGRLFVEDLHHQHGDIINLVVGCDGFCTAASFEALRSTITAMLESTELKFEGAGGAETAKATEGVLSHLSSVAELGYPHLTSWHRGGVVDWLGNELQSESFMKLHSLHSAVVELSDPAFNHTWHLLHSADHLYYMASEWLTEHSDMEGVNPYGSAYEAFINFMNILSDYELELSKALERHRKAEAQSNIKAHAALLEPVAHYGTSPAVVKGSKAMKKPVAAKAKTTVRRRRVADGGAAI